MANLKKNHLKYLPILVIACALFLGFSSRQQKPKKNIGLQLWSVRDVIKTDLKGTIASIGKMGYSNIEAAGYGDGKFYGMEPTEFKTLVEKSGLAFLSSHTGQNLPDAASWDKTMAWWDQCIAAHKAAGVKYIVQPSMGKDAYESLATLKAYCDYFNTVGEKCNAAGIRFGYHNHDKEFMELESEIMYDFMLKNTDPNKVMFQLDLFWIKKGGKNALDYFNNYPGRFELWHVKDKAELGNKPTMDFKPAFEAKEKSGMKYFFVEVEEYNFPPLESVKKSLQFLNKAEYIK